MYITYENNIKLKNNLAVVKCFEELGKIYNIRFGNPYRSPIILYTKPFDWSSETGVYIFQCMWCNSQKSHICRYPNAIYGSASTLKLVSLRVVVVLQFGT